LDRWYGRPPGPAWELGGQPVTAADLASRSLVAGGQALGPAWPVDLPQLRSALTGNYRCATAITQGDVTEPNLAHPMCWLDFEHAGRNALASDTANFLWYLLGMGGWLVPAYQPAVYERTLRNPRPPVTTPVIEHLRVTGRTVEITCTWRAGAGRQAALATLLHRLATDLGTALAPGTCDTTCLRPFLATRILGVIPLHQMSGPHAILCLAQLAGLRQRTWDLASWCATHPADHLANSPANSA